MQSLFYDELVIQHAVSQLNFALDILLKKFTSLAMHKHCLVSGPCWDNRSSKKFWDILDKLKRAIYGQIVEGSLS